MIYAAMVFCCVLCTNSMYAVGALLAASRYEITVSLARGYAFAVLCAGTIVECGAVLMQADAAARIMMLIAFGGVVVAAACDAACGYVFDAVTVPCVAALAVLAAVSHTFGAFAAGVAVAGGALGVLYFITRGKGLGLGDVKLACCIGGASGAFTGMEALGVAFILGGAYGAYLLAAKHAGRKDEIRFAPYLAAGMAVAVLWGVRR